jgi:PAS domain S-box-containing protein
MSASKNSIKPLFIGLAIFCLLMVLTQFLTYQRYLLNKIEEKERVMEAAVSARNNLLSALSYSMAATNTLAFIVQNYGVPKDFEAVSKGLLGSGKFIDAIELTEGGVITHIFPLIGNEKAIGYDILKDSTRSKEALKAIAKRELFFAGPFQLKQGGFGVVGRQPIFKGDNFFGFAVVIIKFSTLVKAIGVNEMLNEEYLFQLSKINPDTKKEEFFLPYDASFDKEQFISIPITNGEWNLYVKPIHQKTILFVLPNIIMGMLFSLAGGFFAWFISKKPVKLQEQVDEKKSKLDKIEKRYQAIAQNSLQALFLSLPDGTILEANSAARKLFGYSEEEFRIIGRQGIIDESVLNFSNKLAERETTGLMQGEVIGIRKGGERFYCEYSSVIFRDASGGMFSSTMITDISSRKKHETRINQLLNENIESKNLFENVLSSVSDGFVALNKNWIYTYVNEKGAALLQDHAPRDLVGKYIWDVFPEGIGQPFHRRYEEVMNYRQSITFLSHFEPWDKYFENRIYPASDGGITIFFTDVTDQIKTEEALKENSLLMTQAQSMAHLGNWQWNIPANKVTWSDELYAIYGLSKEIFEATFEAYLLRLHADDRERVQQIIQHALEKKEAVTFEERIIRPSGEIRYLKSWGLVTTNDDGIPTKMFGACLDVTETKVAEQRQALAEQRFKSMVQEGSDLISILDFDGNYFYVSPACVAILGRQPGEFFSKTAFDFIHPEDKQRVRDDFEKLKSQKKIQLLPFRFLDGTEKYRWLETTITNLMDDPAVHGLVANSSDVTARINYINAIEGQNKILKEIAWMQSHVVRAPLARILGLVNLLMITKEDFKEMSRDELLAHIQSSALELDGIIRNIVHKTEGINIRDKT